MATLTRAAVTLAPVDILGWSTTRRSASVVHSIIGDPAPDVTLREPAAAAGDLRTVWADEASALAASAALAVLGGAWTIAIPARPGIDGMSVLVVGDITVSAADDAGAAWMVTIGVQEVAS